MTKEISRCTGHCCRAFTLPVGMAELQEDYQTYLEWSKDSTKKKPRWQDIGIIGPMVIPLGVGHWDSVKEVLQPLKIQDGGRYQYSCKHFDSVAGNCTNYEGRPTMCRNYPYESVCQYAKCTRKVECGTEKRDEDKQERQFKSCSS